jgi:hypothetical protein
MHAVLLHLTVAAGGKNDFFLRGAEVTKHVVYAEQAGKLSFCQKLLLAGRQRYYSLANRAPDEAAFDEHDNARSGNDLSQQTLVGS